MIIELLSWLSVQLIGCHSHIFLGKLLYGLPLGDIGAKQPIVSLTLSRSSATLPVGDTLVLTAAAPQGTYLLWHSSDEAVATVDNGAVFCLGVGTATVTVYRGGGLSASCEITCYDPLLSSSTESYSAKCRRLFGTVVEDPRLFYANKVDAQADMTEITVSVWDPASDGSKVTRQMSLTVHKAPADSVRAIFREIYEGEEQFPIHYLGGRSRSGKSEHSIGCAIDINYEENYYCDPEGNAIVGSHRKPGESPYSIPLDGEVARIFEKYGFQQVVSWRSGYRDYMHFSYFGT